MGMAKCGDCLYFGMCSHYIDAEESFPEVGGCTVFKRKDAFVEVVRCEDCKACPSFDDNGIGYCWEHGNYILEDDFCSYGERREGE